MQFDPRWSRDDLAVLASHHIVLYAGRVIFDAQPPIEPETLDWVRSKCAGPIPQSLIDLWTITAGGSLDYDLTIEIGNGRHQFSWTELFYRGSDSYRDLDGWIEHELELVDEVHDRAETISPNTTDWLPIGGFEYLCRTYVNVANDERNGQVGVWMYGLPPAWEGRLHEDSFAVLAQDLIQAFGLLRLEVDPRTASADAYPSGLSLMDFVADRVALHSLDGALAERLIEYYVQTALAELGS